MTILYIINKYCVFSMVLLVLMVLVGCAHAFETTVCDCTTNELKGILRTDKFDCEKINDAEIRTEDVNYTIHTTKEQQQTFYGYTCSTWITTRSVSTSFFGGTDTIISKQMNNVSSNDCWKLVNYKSCDSRAMTQRGTKWSSESQPLGGGAWLQVVKYRTLSCVVQEVEFQRDCRLCNLQTPFGEIPPNLQTGVGFFDQITYVWKPEQHVKEVCAITFVQKGNGTIYWENDTRITDNINQLDYMISNDSFRLCDNQSYSKVVGLENIYITWDYVFVRPNGSTGRYKRTEEESLNIQAHAQYNNNLNVKHDNVLADEVRILQCKLKQILKNEIILTSQINPVQAAERMGFNNCHQIIGRGTLVRLIQYEIRHANFTAKKTHCGWQPKAENKTISSDGWNLADYHHCYWTDDIVNFNGKPYRYDDNDWVPIVPNIDISVGRLVQTFQFTIDNSAKWLHQSHPGRIKEYMSQMAVLADVMAEMNGNTEYQETVNVEHGRSKIVEYYDKATSWASKLVFMAITTILLGAVATLVIRFRKPLWVAIRRCCDLPLRPHRPTYVPSESPPEPLTVIYVNSPPTSRVHFADESRPPLNPNERITTPGNTEPNQGITRWSSLVTLSLPK